VVSASNLSIGSSFAVTAWVWNPSNSAYETIAAAGGQRDLFLRAGSLSFFDGNVDRDLGVNVPTGRWAFVALTSDGSTLRAYVDGAAAAPVNAAVTGTSVGRLQIGAWTDGSSTTDYFSGRIDEVRWYGRSLSSSEVAADMATRVSTSGESSTTTIATTTTAPTTTVATTTTAAPTTTTAPSGSGSSLRFFGNGRDGIDRVRIPLTPNRSIDVGGDFTLEWWMKVAGTPVDESCDRYESGWIYGNILLDRDVYGAGDYGDYGVSVFGGGGGTIAFGVSRGSNGVTLCSTVGVADGAWHHVAVTRSSSGAMAIFIDGRRRGSTTGPTGDVSYRDGRSSSAPMDPYLVIGAEKHDAGSEFPSYAGWFDELRVSDTVRYTTDFVPPRSELTADGATVALYHADEGSGTVLGDSTGANPGALRVGGSPTGPLWTSDTPF
jgi:hypothetical protein